MSKPMTLERYLNRAKAENHSDDNGRRQLKTVTPLETRSPSFSPGGHPRSQSHERNEAGILSLIHEKPGTNDSWNTNFFDSKRECLEELRRLREKIGNEEYCIAKYLENYQASVLTSMEGQYQSIKAELNRLLDAAFEENRRRVQQSFRGQGISELAELDSAMKRLSSMKGKIEQLERELQSAAYKRGIAAVVTENFDQEREEILSKVIAALKKYESRVYLRLDPQRFNKLREQASNLITYADHGFARAETLISDSNGRMLQFGAMGHHEEIQYEGTL